jgi:predicted glycosyltransferase
MLTVANYLLDSFEDLSILLVSGSPMVQSFRIRDRLDYVKLPCLRRTERDGYVSRFLESDVMSVVRIRSEMIDAALHYFRPDLVLVDKKPYGIKNELALPLQDYKLMNPNAKLALVLRDILDDPAATRSIWTANGYFDAIAALYDSVLVLGSAAVFDVRTEYEFPAPVAEKVRYCGYLYRQPGPRTRNEVRAELGIKGKERLVLVTAGGGEDGYALLKAYLEGVKELPERLRVRSLLVTGPDMPKSERESLAELAAECDWVHFMEFTDDLTAYMAAADLVVCMCGYNTVCELMSLNKRAIVVPRVKPVQEQLIRAERLAPFGQFTVVRPDELDSNVLAQAVLAELVSEALNQTPSPSFVELDGYDRLSFWVSSLFGAKASEYPVPNHIRPLRASVEGTYFA